LSPDGQILVTTLKDGPLTFFDAKTGIVRKTAPNTNHIFELAFSPNGKLVAAACMLANGQTEGPRARVWDVSTYKMVAALAGHTDIGLSVGFSPDSKTLATSSADDSIRFWDTSSWNEIPPFLRQKEYVTSVAFSPNGRTLATACYDGTMKLWNAVTLRELASIKIEPNGRSFAFSPDGQTLAVQTPDGLRLWRAPVPEKEQARLRDNWR
jgi:WD40 repeat protein